MTVHRGPQRREVGRWPLVDHWIHPSIFDRPRSRLMSARFIVAFCWLFALTCTGAVVPRILFSERDAFDVAFFVLMTLAALSGPLYIQRTGNAEYIGGALVAAGFVGAILGSAILDGLMSISIVWAALLPLLIDFLLGRQRAIAAACAVIAVVLVLLVLQVEGLYPARSLYAHLPPAQYHAELVHRAVNLAGLAAFCGAIGWVNAAWRGLADVGEQRAETLQDAVTAQTGVGWALIDSSGRVQSNSAFDVHFAPLRAAGAEAVIEALAGAGCLARASVSDFECDGRVLEIRYEELPLGAGFARLVTSVDATERARTFGDLLAARTAAEQALRENRVLMREIHHRVKNNLQIISSLLAIEAAGSTSELEQGRLQVTVTRVQSLALVHELLYGSELMSSLDLGTYASSLLVAIGNGMASAPDCSINCPPGIHVDMDIATPVGLMLNELFTNALKHGGGPGGGASVVVDISLHPSPQSGQDARVRMLVRDHGAGFPREVLARSGHRSTGLLLVENLCRQIRARLELRNVEGGGACVEVDFALPAAGKFGSVGQA